MNKKGDEIVEAAMVLPILILTVLSMIMLLIYFFSCLNTQADLHKELIAESLTSEASFDIIKKQSETSSKMGGLVGLVMHKEMNGKIYRIGKADVIRAGEMLDFDR